MGLEHGRLRSDTAWVGNTFNQLDPTLLGETSENGNIVWKNLRTWATSSSSSYRCASHSVVAQRTFTPPTIHCTFPLTLHISSHFRRCNAPGRPNGGEHLWSLIFDLYNWSLSCQIIDNYKEKIAQEAGWTSERQILFQLIFDLIIRMKIGRPTFWARTQELLWLKIWPVFYQNSLNNGLWSQECPVRQVDLWSLQLTNRSTLAPSPFTRVRTTIKPAESPSTSDKSSPSISRLVYDLCSLIPVCKSLLTNNLGSQQNISMIVDLWCFGS